MEIWKDIPDFEGLYQASNLGRIKSVEKIGLIRGKFSGLFREKILSPRSVGVKKRNRCDYHRVMLYKNGVKTQCSIHRLVAATFLGLNLNDKKQIVMHIDDDGINNNLDNLRIGNTSENAMDREKKGRGGKNWRKNQKTVLQYSTDGSFIKTWNSVREIHRNLGYNVGGISNCALGFAKTAYGFVWEYKK